MEFFFYITHCIHILKAYVTTMSFQVLLLYLDFPLLTLLEKAAVTILPQYMYYKTSLFLAGLFPIVALMLCLLQPKYI